MHSLFLKYWSYQLTLKNNDRNITDLTLTLSDAKIDLLPHQISAVEDALRSLKENNGVILADEVGLGKTIEAGIIISRLWQMGKRRILIITPAGLVTQWKGELLTRLKITLHFMGSMLH